MNHNDATANGYAAFNQGDHVTIDVPDTQTTYSFRTSDGRRLTACFMLARDGNPPEIVDIAYHGTEAEPTKDSQGHQAFESILFGKVSDKSRGSQFDTRSRDYPANIICILMEKLKER